MAAAWREENAEQVRQFAQELVDQWEKELDSYGSTLHNEGVLTGGESGTVEGSFASLRAYASLTTAHAFVLDHYTHEHVPTLYCHAGRFLAQLRPDDPESIQALQTWFGYCLVADTSQQKVLMLVGPRRGGEGAIGRVQRELVRDANCVGPRISSLATQFRLQGLVGKTLTIVSDARFDLRPDVLGTVVERETGFEPATFSLGS